MDKQIEFMIVSKEQDVLLGVSNLVNSGNWTGELWYFTKEEDILDGCVITNNSCYLKYSVPISVCDGSFLKSERKIVVGNDIGWLSIYSITEPEDDKNSDSLCAWSKSSESCYTFSNDLSRIEHDRSILSVTVSNENNSNQKIATGSMDCSIIIWDVDTFSPEIIYSTAHTHYVTCVRFAGCNLESKSNARNTNGEIFASTSLDGRCLLWDRRQSFPAQILLTIQNTGLTVCEWFDESNNQLIIGNEVGNLILVDTRNSKDVITHMKSFHRSVNEICSFSKNSEKFIAVSGESRTIKVFHYNNMSFEEIYANNCHNDYVRGLAWYSNQEKLLACSWDSKISKHYPFHAFPN